MEIVQKHEQPLLSRTWLTGSVAFDSVTPSNKSLANDIASSLKVDASLVVLKKISTAYGKKEASWSAVVYSNAKAKNTYEVKTKKIKEIEAKAAKDAAESAASKGSESKEKEQISGQVASSLSTSEAHRQGEPEGKDARAE